MSKTFLRLSCMVILLLAPQAEAGFFVPRFVNTAGEPPKVLAADNLPAKFDLRDEGRITPIRDQSVWATCWAHAAMTAIESNALTFLNTTPEFLDLSEMHMVWFSRINQDRSRSFSMYDRGNTTLLHMGDYGTALQEGAYPSIALAYLARLDGPVIEGDFPYPDSAYFSKFGYSTGNPPTHSEAESAGMIPLRSSTTDNLVFSNTTTRPSMSLRMTDALFAASFIVPAAYANQRKDYADMNRINNDALKALIYRYGAAMIGYYSSEAVQINLNTQYNSYYEDATNSWKGNHEITLIGWDDNYPKENFTIQPSSNGAWLARNSWGEFYGSDGGYEWISYEQFIGDGVVCVMAARPENLHVYEHDPLGWCNSFTSAHSTLAAANVFKVDSDNETLDSVGFYTNNTNIRVDVMIYDLGADFAGKDPEDGTLLYSTTETMYYPGYHTVKVEGTLTKNNYFSVVLRYTDPSGGVNGFTDMPIEVPIKYYSDSCAIHDGESFFLEQGRDWVDGAYNVDDTTGKSYPANVCIKAFTIAPNFTARAAVSKTIHGVAVDTFKAADTTRVNETSASVAKSVTLRVGGANEDVSFYLIDKSKVYEKASVSAEERLDSEGYPKGRTGPTEWVEMPLYTAGYKPDLFWSEEGVDFPVYGPFTAVTDANGQIVVNVDALEYPDGSNGSIPESYYTVYCETSAGSTSELGVARLSASSVNHRDTPSTNPDSGNTGSNSGESNNASTSGGGGGCNAGFAVAGLIVIAALFRKFHK